MKIKKFNLFLQFISLTVLMIPLSCTCDFEFNYRGLIIDDSTQQPIYEAEIRTIDFDLYAIDPEQYNRYEWGEIAYSDSLGIYKAKSFGLYDCGCGKPVIDDPGDLGRIYFHIQKDGYLSVDTSFYGDSLSLENGFYIIPDIYLTADL